MKKIAAIVVTYNRCELLKECIEALLGSETAADVIVVDNASTDETPEILQAYASDSRIFNFRTEANLGGAGGFHYGIKKAYEMGYDYFWLMDDDTIAETDSLKKLLAVDEALDGQYGFLSGLALWKDGEDCLINYHVIAMDWNLEKKRIREGIVKVEVATFVSFFVPRAVVEKVGLPIKEYFIWGDDTEYSRRISREFPCYLAVNSTVTHKMEKNLPSGEIADMEDISRIERMFYSVRNDCCTYRRIGWKSFVRYTINTVRMFLGVLLRAKVHKGKKLKIILKGYFAGVIFAPKIETVE